MDVWLSSRQAKSNTRFKNYGGIVDAVRRIYREEGFKAFFRGLSVSYLGLLETAIQFTWYVSFYPPSPAMTSSSAS